jgi:hypothetical protein
MPDFMVSIGIWGWSTHFLNIALLEAAQKRTKTLMKHFFFNNFFYFCWFFVLNFSLTTTYRTHTHLSRNCSAASELALSETMLQLAADVFLSAEFPVP